MCTARATEEGGRGRGERDPLVERVPPEEAGLPQSGTAAGRLATAPLQNVPAQGMVLHDVGKLLAHVGGVHRDGLLFQIRAGELKGRAFLFPGDAMRKLKSALAFALDLESASQ